MSSLKIKNVLDERKNDRRQGNQGKVKFSDFGQKLAKKRVFGIGTRAGADKTFMTGVKGENVGYLEGFPRILPLEDEC